MNEREKFDKWMKEDGIELATLSEKCAAFKGWKAALSTRKAYGYGIVDKDGEGIEGIAATEKRCAEIEAQHGNDNEYSSLRPFRVVELFYEDSES